MGGLRVRILGFRVQGLVGVRVVRWWVDTLWDCCPKQGQKQVPV